MEQVGSKKRRERALVQLGGTSDKSGGARLRRALTSIHWRSELDGVSTLRSSATEDESPSPFLVPTQAQKRKNQERGVFYGELIHKHQFVREQQHLRELLPCVQRLGRFSRSAEAILGIPRFVQCLGIVRIGPNELNLRGPGEGIGIRPAAAIDDKVNRVARFDFNWFDGC